MASGILDGDLDDEHSIPTWTSDPGLSGNRQAREPVDRHPRLADQGAHVEQKARSFPAQPMSSLDTLRPPHYPRLRRQLRAAERAIDENVSAAADSGFRASVGSSFIRLGDLGLPAALAGICREVPEARFREDISSTEIRRRQRDGYENDLC